MSCVQACLPAWVDTDMEAFCTKWRCLIRQTDSGSSATHKQDQQNLWKLDFLRCLGGFWSQCTPSSLFFVILGCAFVSTFYIVCTCSERWSQEKTRFDHRSVWMALCSPSHRLLTSHQHKSESKYRKQTDKAAQLHLTNNGLSCSVVAGPRPK